MKLKTNLFLILFRTTVFPRIVNVYIHYAGEYGCTVTYVTIFETNKRDVSEGSSFKKFDHTLVELSDNGMYQKVQPLKSSTSSEDELVIPIGNKVA